MKLKRFIVLCALFLSAAAAFAAGGITLNCSNAQLGTVLRELTHQSGYTFVYSDQVVNEANSVTINVKDASNKAGHGHARQPSRLLLPH